MKRTLSGIFRNSCATAFTPLAVLSVAPITQAQPIVKPHRVPALSQAAELRPQESAEPSPQAAKVVQNFSFSSMPVGFLAQANSVSSQARPSIPTQTSETVQTSEAVQTSSSRVSLPSPPPDRSSPTLVAQNASDAAPKSRSTPDIPDYLQNEKPNRFFIGPEIFYRNYNEEEIRPGFKSFEYGFLYGVKVQYDYVKRNSVYVGTDFRYNRGQTSYRGILQDTNTGNVLAPYNSTTNNEFINFEGRLGYTFKADKVGRLLLTPFVGYGYQQWNRNLSGNGEIPGVGSSPINDSSEDYSWNYLAGGLRAEYRPSRRFTVGMNFKLMGMLNGTVDNKVAGQPEGTLALGNTIQAEVEFPLTYHIVDKPKSGIDLRFTPFYRSQNIARGNFREGVGIEPASTTDVYGATAGVVFSF
jgi:hypothetical protein